MHRSPELQSTSPYRTEYTNRGETNDQISTYSKTNTRITQACPPRRKGKPSMPAIPVALVLRYLFAALSVLLVLLLKSLLDPWIGKETPFLLFFGAILVSAWLGGLGPGLLATALSAA